LPSANPAAWSHVFKTETDLYIDIKCKTKYRFSSFAHIQTTTCGAMVHFRTKAILWIAPDWRQALRSFYFLNAGDLAAIAEAGWLSPTQTNQIEEVQG
jgi:hypothetical protein